MKWNQDINWKSTHIFFSELFDILWHFLNVHVLWNIYACTYYISYNELNSYVSPVYISKGGSCYGGHSLLFFIDVQYTSKIGLWSFIFNHNGGGGVRLLTSTTISREFELRSSRNKRLYHMILTDWLIDYCLTFSEQYFSYIQDDNKLNNI